MKTACIVQARLGSKRLPAKILLPLPNYLSVLETCLTRCRLIKGIDVLVCAIADDEGSDIVADTIAWMTDTGAYGETAVRITRGPEEDVLKRYLMAAEEVGADVILRVTSDCPFIDPLLCEKVLETRAEFGGYDYVSNNDPPTFIHGLDCEAFTIEALRKADAHETDLESRQHVTEWLRTAPEINKYNVARIGGSQAHIRLTLDTLDDYIAIRAEFKRRLAAGEPV